MSLQGLPCLDRYAAPLHGQAGGVPATAPYLDLAKTFLDKEAIGRLALISTWRHTACLFPKLLLIDFATRRPEYTRLVSYQTAANVLSASPRLSNAYSKAAQKPE